MPDKPKRASEYRSELQGWLALGRCGRYPQSTPTFPESPMRLEATIPESRGAAILKLADELGLTKSQLIDEALTLFLAAVMEVRRGRRLMTMEQGASQPACEIVTPTLSAMEWAM